MAKAVADVARLLSVNPLFADDALASRASRN